MGTYKSVYVGGYVKVYPRQHFPHSDEDYNLKKRSHELCYYIPKPIRKSKAYGAYSEKILETCRRRIARY